MAANTASRRAPGQDRGLRANGDGDLGEDHHQVGGLRVQVRREIGLDTFLLGSDPFLPLVSARLAVTLEIG